MQELGEDHLQDTMTDEERNRLIEYIKTLPKGEVNLDD